jgi:hypothetical protein
MHECMQDGRVVRSAKKVDLQIRGMPIELRRRIGRKAGSKGLSISRYVIDVLENDAGLPRTIDEWLDEVERNLGPFRDQPGRPLSRTVRETRDAIDRGEEP